MPKNHPKAAIDPQAAWPFPKAPAVKSPDPAADSPARASTAKMRLYTDPSQNQVERIRLEQLLESPFNPRTHYDPQALETLADTIRGVGVMQPILVRPIAASGWSITNGEATVQPYEIVFGHRRYRAAKIAGEAEVPAFVRTLTDSESAQLQAIENAQREDLTPMEEARAYAHYLKVHGVSKEALGEELGLSRSHVYGRLKLLDAVPAVQEALVAGEIGSEVAEAIARIHTPKLQERALGSLASQHHDLEDGGKRSVRSIKRFLREKFTLDLKQAIFDTEDAQLLPGADACTTCPKRTGNAPEYHDMTVDEPTDRTSSYYHSHGNPNLCTDLDCFEAKKKAALQIKADALAAKGKTVIAGNKARTLISATGELKGGYIPLKEVKADLAKASKAKKGDEAPAIETVVIQNPRDGKTIEVVKQDVLEAAGVKVKPPAAQRGPGGNYQQHQRHREQERASEEAEAAAETRVNLAVLGAVRRAAAGQPLTTLALQLATAAALEGVGYQEHELIAELHGFKRYEDLQKAVGSMPAERLATLLLDCGLVTDVVVDMYHRVKPAPLLAAAKHYDVDVAKLRKDVAALPKDTKTRDLLEGTERASPPDPAAAPPAASSQEPKKKPAKAKKSAAQAVEQESQLGIADAMQGDEGAGASTPSLTGDGGADAAAARANEGALA